MDCLIFYIHRLRIFDVDDCEAFGLLSGEETELDLLNSAHGGARVSEIEIRHDGDCILGRR